MPGRSSILANIFSFSAGQIVALIIGLATHAILARAVGPADYGILGFATVIVSYFGVVAALGIDTWGTREIATARENVVAITGTVVSMRLALTGLAYLAIIGLVLLWAKPATVTLVVLIQAAGLFTAALTLDFAFQGLERMHLPAWRQIMTAALSFLGIVMLVQADRGIVLAAVVLQAAALAAVLYMVFKFIRGVGRITLGVNWSLWRAIIRDSGPIAITGIINVFYLSIDIVMLGFFRPEAEVGLYVAAVKVFTTALIAAHIFRTVFFPALVRLKDDPQGRLEAGLIHARVVVIAGGLLAVGGFLLGPEILAILFGAAFADAIVVLQILMVNLLMVHVVAIYHTQLVAWHLHKQQMVVMAIGAAVNIALNAYLIPAYGMEGAAVTTVISTAVVIVLCYWVLRRHRFEAHEPILIRVVTFAVACGIGGYLLLGLVPAGFGNAALRFLVLGAGITIVYAVLAWSLRLLRPAETVRYMKKEQEAG